MLLMMGLTIAAAVISSNLLNGKRVAYNQGWFGDNPSSLTSSVKGSASAGLSGLVRRLLQVDGEQAAFPNKFAPEVGSNDASASVAIYESLSFPKKISLTYFEPNEMVFNFLEVLRIYAFQFAFTLIVKKLMVFQNIKYKSDHEDKLILFLSVFQIINSSFFLIIVIGQSVFLGDYIQVQADSGSYIVIKSVCLESNCGRELANFVLLFCVVKIIFVVCFKFLFVRIFKFVTEKAIKLTKVFKTEEKKKEQPPLEFYEKSKRMTSAAKVEFAINMYYRSGTHPYHDETDEAGDLGLQSSSIAPEFGKYNIYSKIDEEISRQASELQAVNTSDDYNPLLDDYLQLFNSLGVSSLFGILFPLAFLVTWMNAFVEYVLDRDRYLTKLKRLIPQSSTTIGLWKNILELLSILTVITNAVYLSFILFEKKQAYIRFIIFILLSVSFMVIVQLYDRHHANNEGKAVGNLVRRASYIENLLFKGASQTKVKTDKLKVDVSSKIFNTVLFRSRVENIKDLINAEEVNAQIREDALTKAVLKLITKHRTKFHEYQHAHPEACHPLQNPKDSSRTLFKHGDDIRIPEIPKNSLKFLSSRDLLPSPPLAPLMAKVGDFDPFEDLEPEPEDPGLPDLDEAGIHSKHVK